MNAPFFTIIIPTYNARKTLSVAVDSILAQEFADLELLIMDGASTDGSVQLIEEYAGKDKRVRFVSEKDKGIYDAMNKAIGLAKGEWLYFLGCDDRLYDNKVLLNVQRTISKTDCQVVYANVFSEYHNRIYDGEFTTARLYQRNICHQGIFLNKTVFSVIGDFNTLYKSHADWDHNIRWFHHAGIKKVFVDEVYAVYSAGGFSSVHDDKAFDYDKDFIFIRHANNLMDRQTKAALYLSLAIKRKQEKKYRSFWFYKIKFWLTKYA